MSEQPETGAPQAPGDAEQGVTPRPVPRPPEHVRTAGETDVDDAIGASDDPAR
jgi:hypothetical protein